MSEVTFRPHFQSGELQSLAVPVEIRKPNLSLVAQTVSTASVRLDPGHYHVVARLPAGQELYGQVTITDGPTEPIDLYLDAEDVSPHESHEVQRYLYGLPSTALTPGLGDRGLESLGSDEVSAVLRVFEGDALTGKMTPLENPRPLQPQTDSAPGVAVVSVLGTAPSVAQLLQPNRPPINVRLPVAPAGHGSTPTSVVLREEPDGTISLRVQVANVAADALLRYLERGLLDQAAQTANDPANQAEYLLQAKGADPVAATIGAYWLLRVGELDRLHEWTQNLHDWFPWLPDGVAIRAEHLARLGRHQEAVTTLVGLAERGLPIFSDGLSYAIDRLRLYSDAEVAQAAGLDVPPAGPLLASLQRFASFVDFRRAVVTYPGLQPETPSDEPLGPDLLGFAGLEVSALLWGEEQPAYA